MYIPHGDYPKKQNGFNIIDMTPGLFRKINLGDFSQTIGSRRFGDFYNAAIFLFSSKYQQNDGAKLVMMLSAIERCCGVWKPLEAILKNRDTKLRMSDLPTGKEAYDFLEKTIEEYLDNFGATRSLISFFKENLTDREKRILTGGIRRSFVYKKSEVKNGTLFTPTYNNKNEPTDVELGHLLRSFIYRIRSEFVHGARYVLIPGKKHMKKNILFQIDMYEQGLPKEHWVSIVPFERLHCIFRNAFVRYWRKEYQKEKKK